MDDRAFGTLLSLCDSFQIRQLQGQTLSKEEVLLMNHAASCCGQVLRCYEEGARRTMEKALDADQPETPDILPPGQQA